MVQKNNPNVFAGRDWFKGLKKDKLRFIKRELVDVVLFFQSTFISNRFVPYNGALGEAQLKWLTKELEDAESG